MGSNELNLRRSCELFPALRLALNWQTERQPDVPDKAKNLAQWEEDRVHRAPICAIAAVITVLAW